MQIRKCTIQGLQQLTRFNKQLITDIQRNRSLTANMDVSILESRHFMNYINHTILMQK